MHLNCFEISRSDSFLITTHLGASHSWINVGGQNKEELVEENREAEEEGNPLTPSDQAGPLAR